jgi:hypothetical protein
MPFGAYKRKTSPRFLTRREQGKSAELEDVRNP